MGFVVKKIVSGGPARLRHSGGPARMTIWSGGQTGVDRAALDAALALGIPCGGWCPKGRLAEDGPIAALYPLTETSTESYDERTELNVQHSDGTLILMRGFSLFGGTAYTAELARSLGKPLLVLDLWDKTAENNQRLIDWLQQEGISTLNVAGPRESGEPGIYDEVVDFLEEVLSNQDFA
jgi:hypothetical protein